MAETVLANRAGVTETLRVSFASRRNSVPADTLELCEFRDTRHLRFPGTALETRRVSDGLYESVALVNAVSPPFGRSVEKGEVAPSPQKLNGIPRTVPFSAFSGSKSSSSITEIWGYQSPSR